MDYVTNDDIECHHDDGQLEASPLVEQDNVEFYILEFQKVDASKRKGRTKSKLMLEA